MPDVLDAVAGGEVDCGVVPIENSIEGVVNFTQDAPGFDYDLLITREIVVDIELCLVGPAGQSTRGRQGRAVDPRRHGAVPPLPARAPARRRDPCRPRARPRRPAWWPRAAGTARWPSRPRVAADLYGLEVLAGDIEDHAGNQTRFVLVARDGIPAPTGHDRTAMVVYQRADEPGSLISILQEFAARRINLSNLISRPTKRGGLGDYCFVIYAEAHIDDELMADALRELHAKQGAVKFFGSYPAAGEHAPPAPASTPTPAGAPPTTGSPPSAAASSG